MAKDGEGACKFLEIRVDGARTVAKVEHERAAVSLEKMMRALG